MSVYDSRECKIASLAAYGLYEKIAVACKHHPSQFSRAIKKVAVIKFCRPVVLRGYDIDSRAPQSPRY